MYIIPNVMLIRIAILDVEGRGGGIVRSCEQVGDGLLSGKGTRYEVRGIAEEQDGGDRAAAECTHMASSTARGEANGVGLTWEVNERINRKIRS